ncbi:MAG: hypothetical protein M0Z69_13130 [Actinomycetota bacterium]|nr:hypothetical protein [Actinomycetota bacterium]
MSGNAMMMLPVVLVVALGAFGLHRHRQGPRREQSTEADGGSSSRGAGEGGARPWR